MNLLKRLTALSFLTIMISSFAHADYVSRGSMQTYINLLNGNIITLKSAYDPTGLPWYQAFGEFYLRNYHITKERGNYFVTRDRKLRVIAKFDFEGANYPNDFYIYTVNYSDYNENKIAKFGDSFFITNNGNLVIIDKNGALHKKRFETRRMRRNYKNARLIGGNYLVTANLRLKVVTPDGMLKDETAQIGEEFPYEREDITVKGYNWFQTSDGKTFTIGMTYSDFPVTNGRSQYRVVIREYTSAQVAFQAGGNYYFDRQFYLHTIGLDGVINLGDTDRQFRPTLGNEPMRVLNWPVSYGLNYFIFEVDGQFKVMQIEEGGMMMELPYLPSAPALD